MISGGVINTAWLEGTKNKTITINPSDWIENDGVISYTKEDEDIEDNSFIPVVVEDNSREIANKAGLGNYKPICEIGKITFKADAIPEGAITLTYSIVL